MNMKLYHIEDAPEGVRNFLEQETFKMKQIQDLYNLYIQGGRKPLSPLLMPAWLAGSNIFIDARDSEGRLLPPPYALFASSNSPCPCGEVSLGEPRPCTLASKLQ